MSILPPIMALEHLQPARLRPTARPNAGTVGATVSGPAHGSGILAPGLAVTDASAARGVMRGTENRAALTSMQADVGQVSPGPRFGGPCLPPFAIPALESRSGPGAKGSRDVRDVAPPARRRRSLFRRWGAGQ